MGGADQIDVDLVRDLSQEIFCVCVCSCPLSDPAEFLQR